MGEQARNQFSCFGGNPFSFLPVKLPGRDRGLKPKFPGTVYGFVSRNASAIPAVD